MTAAEYVIEALGGHKVFKGRGAPTATELRDRVRTGLPYQSLESIRERLNLTLPEGGPGCAVAHPGAASAWTQARRRRM